MAREYLNQPVFTQEKFVPNPFGEDSSDRLYKTGDQCRWLEDGSIEFLGRRDQQIKIRGFRVELGEIEAALCRHEAISQAIAMVRDADDLLTAWVVPDGDTAPSSAELRSYLQNDLPPWMVPSRVMVIDEIPLTPNGKVDRRALPETTDQQQSESAYIAPRSETETKVASFWEQLLKTDRVGVLDNFFDLGGHSLLATQLISRIRKEFGIELPLRALFDHPNVQDLATAIDAALWAIDSVKSTGTGPVEEGAI
jgi:acyl carrier protein